MIHYVPAEARADIAYSGKTTCRRRRMEHDLGKYASLDDMKADEYRYWQSRPVHERMAAVVELNEAMYAPKGTAGKMDQTLGRGNASSSPKR
jgi:hypothetical protein